MSSVEMALAYALIHGNDHKIFLETCTLENVLVNVSVNGFLDMPNFNC